MKKLISGALIVLSLLLISSCATTKRPGTKFNPVYVTNTRKFYLLPPENIAFPVDEQQYLSANFGKNAVSLLAYTKADENGIFMQLFNDFGTSMGTLEYDGKSVKFDSTVFPKKLKAEYILADLQYAYYRCDELREAFEKLGLDFMDTVSDGYKKRVISSRDEVIEEITYLENTITITNYLRGYTYILTGAEE